MKEITSDKIEKIINIIEQFAFQSNILPLHAAVEAARSGNAGTGFAVVAEEVRKSRAAEPQAAKDPAASIEESIARSNEGRAKLDDRPAEADVQPRSKMRANPLAQDPELLGDFILESREHLANIEKQVLALERNPRDGEAIHSIFRGFHTVKGLAGFLDLAALQELAHEVETLLERARNDEVTVTPAIIDLILAGADYVKRGTDVIEASLRRGPPAAMASEPVLLERIRTAISGNLDEAAPEAVIEGADAQPPAEEPAAKGEPQVNAAAGTRRQAIAASVKVDTAKLDYLVQLMGEMAIALAMVRHNPHIINTQNPRLTANLSQLSSITRELQKLSIAMRMVAVGQLFQRTARLVRDLARKSGKKVELIIKGEETELDRTLIEELADPLMHMIRNSIDHGLETEEDRVAAGKDATGRITLTAGHQSGHIVIEIADDGRGLDRQKIRRKAIERNLLTANETPSDSELFGLIFTPGFSTADKVTDISGRGVGLDVVRRQLEKLRGRVEVESRAGIGTRFTMKLPLTSGDHRGPGVNHRPGTLHPPLVYRAGNAKADAGDGLDS